MEKQLAQVLPIKSIEQGGILSKMGDYTLVYEVLLPEIFTLADQDYEAFHQAWIKAIRLLPQHCILHKQDWYTEKRV